MIARFSLWRRFFLLIFAGFVFNSCASQPKLVNPELPAAGFASLGLGASGYFYVDVPRSRSILGYVSLGGLEGKAAGRILDQVDTLSGALYPLGFPQRMILHARSHKNIPGGLGLALSFRWKKQRSPDGKPYWHSAPDGLSVALRGKEAFISDGNPFPEAPPVAVPEKIQEFQQRSLMVGWLENAGPPINKFLSDLGMPVQIPTDRILFGVYPMVSDKEGSADTPAAGGVYELRLRIETQNTPQSKALATLFSVVQDVPEGSEIKVKKEYLDLFKSFLTNPPIPDGAGLIVRTGPMNAREIALLFNEFSVYSQPKENKNADL
jgi:hypothetical protein